MRRADGATVLYGRCERDMGFSYQPFAEALQHVVAYHEIGGAPEADCGRRRRRPGPHLPTFAVLAPDLPPPWCRPEAERHRLFDAVAGWLRGPRRAQPGVLVVDDLQKPRCPPC